MPEAVGRGAVVEVGCRVRVVASPPDLPDDDLRTRDLFDRCVGREFAVVSTMGSLLELEVGDVVGEPAHMHSIWVEADLVTRVE